MHGRNLTPPTLSTHLWKVGPEVADQSLLLQSEVKSSDVEVANKDVDYGLESVASRELSVYLRH